MGARGNRDGARGRAWIGAVAGVVALVVLTVVLRLLGSGTAGGPTLTSVALLYLIPTVITAGAGGIRLGLAAAVASDLALNWFFIPPYHTLAVDRRDNLIALLIYALVAVAVAVAVEAAARQRAAAARSEAEAARADAEAARQAERATELASIDRLRTAILASVGHDLRTPLAAIKAASSSLRARDVTFSAEDRDELLATVEESADRLGDLVENLLAMSRLQAGVLSVRVRPVALDEVVAGALRHTRAPDVEILLPDDLPLVTADPGLLERVVANLVSNAVKAARAEPGRPGTVRIQAGSFAGTASMSIIDHGIGIPASERDRVFAPFQRLDDRRPDDRRADGGLGLGLAIARGFTEAMGGTLTPAETPGGGLTMTVRLPVAE